ncbi:MAG: bifunctional hydroxymethylpyrimidine kinase/phosphomethylpyrimidine kinase [Deltaproteobacteria bacterium]|nr:bifunctional hydroxymethylpyrimidine kinase/phosphomethylpyrimidine kinase [Deltaproteobacteria bacterium]
MNEKKYFKVLTIAGSDSSGGAGIQADLKTVSALGCYGMSVITALTAQNTNAVTAVHGVPPAFVEAQLEAVFSDMGADAVKIGMLYSTEVIEIVALQLKKHRPKNIVLDPVMVSQSGDPLIQDEAFEAIKELLMPLTTVLTPNIPEASVLVNYQICSLEDMHTAARQLASFGAKGILIKGGHLDEGGSTDVFYVCAEDRFVVLKSNRIVTKNNHGTGCTLSSAIAAYLAKGLPVEESVKQAKDFLTEAIRAGGEYEIGSGHGPVHHFHDFW